MTYLYIEYDERRDEHEVHGVMIPHIKNISWIAPEQYEILDNGCIGEMSTIQKSDESTFVAIPIPKANFDKISCEYLYVLIINESGSGGSYHEIDFIYLETEFDDALEHSIDYFENEHNRDSECELCQDDPNFCKNKLVDDLKQGYSEIETSCYEGAGAMIYKISLPPI
jgi:hypothetical protein